MAWGKMIQKDQNLPKNSGITQKVNGIDQIVTDHFWGLLLNQRVQTWHAWTWSDPSGPCIFWGFEHVWGPWLEVQKWASCQKSDSEAKEFEHEKLPDSKNWIESDRMNWIRFESDRNESDWIGPNGLNWTDWLNRTKSDSNRTETDWNLNLKSEIANAWRLTLQKMLKLAKKLLKLKIGRFWTRTIVFETERLAK